MNSNPEITKQRAEEINASIQADSVKRWDKNLAQ